MKIPGNLAQQAVIEEEWELWSQYDERPPKKRCLRVAVECSHLGPFVTSQEIGRYFANRFAAANGVPRATRKTPAQLAQLQEVFEQNAWPLTGERILLVHDTGLTKKQVQSWFEQQRKKAEKEGRRLADGDILRPDATFEETNRWASKMWRAFNKDPAAYAESIRSGKVCVETGEVIDEDGDVGMKIEFTDGKSSDEEVVMKEERRAVKKEEKRIGMARVKLGFIKKEEEFRSPIAEKVDIKDGEWNRSPIVHKVVVKKEEEIRSPIAKKLVIKKEEEIRSPIVKKERMEMARSSKANIKNEPVTSDVLIKTEDTNPHSNRQSKRPRVVKNEEMDSYSNKRRKRERIFKDEEDVDDSKWEV
ncbi:Homeo [Glarea lozoyensis ATCC 20868]|uniref:Homeo n=1 Tax=Glarea lozoyensis (strain ATCC 20868 / MF5171) TaxID=1116229 RepID=S3CZ53_GLAL2|nr:Homeo [Glarea lozoyensis ATCC 20868]EPE25126.1 Homeo [Glarea lozoyensis ATCC 20868]